MHAWRARGKEILAGTGLAFSSCLHLSLILPPMNIIPLSDPDTDITVLEYICFLESDRANYSSLIT